MNSTQRHGFDRIQKEVNQLLKQGFPQRLHQSADGILRTILTIVDTEGEEWATKVVDDEGTPIFTEEEQKTFTTLLEPYISVILAFFKETKRGGGEDDDEFAAMAKSGNSLEMNTSKYNKVAKQKKNEQNEFAAMAQATNAYSEKNKEQNNASMKNNGIDNLYENVMKKLGSINSMTTAFASKHGVLKYEKQADQQYDVHLAPLALRMEFPFLEPLQLPLRTIIFIIQLFLDTSRMAASVADEDSSRKILSIASGLLELLRGDWKKSLLSFIGFYGHSPLLFGQIVKTYLSLFRTLSPTIQDSITYGIVDTTKSFLIGVLLQIFQLTAPLSVRLNLIPLFHKISLKKKEIDGLLKNADLKPRADYFAPSFEDLNNLQSLMDDPAFICSKEFEELIVEVNKTTIINMILQLMRIPVTRQFRKYRCGSKPAEPFITKIVKEGMPTPSQKEKIPDIMFEQNTEPETSAMQLEAKQSDAKQSEAKQPAGNSQKAFINGMSAAVQTMKNQYEASTRQATSSVSTVTAPPVIETTTTSTNAPVPQTVEQVSTPVPQTVEQVSTPVPQTVEQVSTSVPQTVEQVSTPNASNGKKKGGTRKKRTIRRNRTRR